MKLAGRADADILKRMIAMSRHVASSIELETHLLVAWEEVPGSL